MPFYQSKSGKVIEVESSWDTETGEDKTRSEAISKGWTPVQELISPSGKKILVSDDGLEEAYKKGWQLPQVAEAKDKPIEVSPAETAARSVADVFTFGAADEAAAKLQSLRSGRPFEKELEEYRSITEAGQEQNPITSTAASFGAGMVGGGAAIGKTLAQTAAKGAALAGAYGFGSGEGLEDRAKKAATYGTVGAVTPVVIGGIAKGLKTLPQKGKDLENLGRTAYAGAKEASSEAVSTPLTRPFDAASGAYKAVKETRRFNKDLAKAMSESAKERVAGSGKVLPPSSGDAGSDFAIDLLIPGTNKAKEFAATKAATMAGQIDKDQYQKVLELGVDRVQRAMKFDKKATAKELQGSLVQLKAAFKQARNKGFEKLQNEAGESFTLQTKELGKLRALERKLVSDKDFSLIPKTDQRDVEAAMSIIKSGSKRVGGLGKDITELPISKVSPKEAFNRLQAARSMIDEKANIFKAGGLKNAEREMISFRKEIDNLLKKVDAKGEADRLYSFGKEVERDLFDPLRFDRGRVEVDEVALSKVFGDNDRATRFRNAIENAREYIKDPNFDPKVAKQFEGVLDKLDEIQQLAADQRLIQGLRMKQGPTSPAIERMTYGMKKSGIPQEAVGAPASFINSSSQFMSEFAPKIYGKTFAELERPQQRKLVNLFMWSKRNPNATPEELQKAAADLLK